MYKAKGCNVVTSEPTVIITTVESKGMAEVVAQALNALSETHFVAACGRCGEPFVAPKGTRRTECKYCKEDIVNLWG